MDTLTHALSAALLARLIAARRPTAPAIDSAAPIGRIVAPWDGRPGAPKPWHCVVAGFVAGAFPDIDSLTQGFGDVFYLTQHRGLTHSVLLLPVWAFAVAWLTAKCFAVTRDQPGGWKSLYLVAFGGIAIHIAGDWITSFGTMLLQPFSNRRFGLGAVFIIDLALSGIFVAGLALAALLPRRRWPAALGLAASVGWVGVAWTGQQEAIAVGARRAQAIGVAAPAIDAMPRPASPFNWTVTVFDGTNYHVAHVNTRRAESLTASGDDHFLRRYSAPYQPERLAEWTVVPRFGASGTPHWVRAAWDREAFGFFRWFAQAPALVGAAEELDEQGRRQRCAWFRDLRFDFPGRDATPFRYGVCLIGSDPAPARVYRLEGATRRPV